MQALVLTLHILACLFLIIVVLLQAGKEGMGVIFGGGSSSLFGSSGAGGLLTKITALVAAVFLVTSLGYNILTKKPTAPEASVMEVPFEEQRATEPKAPEGVTIEDSGAEKAPQEAPAGK